MNNCIVCDLLCDDVWCMFVFVALVCVVCLNVCGLIVVYCLMVYGRLFVLVCVRVFVLCACVMCDFEFVGVFCVWCLFVCVFTSLRV